MGAIDSFVLSDDAPIRIGTETPEIQRWQPPAHLGLHRPALVVGASDRIVLPTVSIDQNTSLYVEFGPGSPQFSRGGATLMLSAFTGDRRHYLAAIPVTGEQTAAARSATIHLGHIQGQSAAINVEIEPGPQSNTPAEPIS